MKAKDLLASLALPFAVAERTGTLSVLQHIRLAGGRALASSFDSTVEVDCALELGCCVPGQRLADALGAIAMYAGEAEIKTKLTGQVLELRAGRSRYTMPTLAADDFPVPRWPEKPEPVADWAALVEAILFTKPFAAADKELRKYLIGVALQGHDVVASDGAAAATARAASAAEYNLIIPARALPVLCDLPAVTAIARTESALMLVFERGRMLIQLVAERYPDMQRFVPEKHEGDAVTVEHDALKRACAALRKTQEAKYLRFTLAPNRLTLEDETATAASRVELEVAYAGREISVGIRLEYLAAAVDGIDGPHVQISQKADGAPLFLTGGKTSRAVVIMPARL